MQIINLISPVKKRDAPNRVLMGTLVRKIPYIYFFADLIIHKLYDIAAMQNIQVPDVLIQHRQIGHGDISFFHYRETAPVGKNLISFNKCAISFILSGQKELYRLSESVVVNQGEGVIIPYGNSIIAERKLDNENYSSLVIFFPENIASNFIKKNSGPFNNGKMRLVSETPGFVKFTVTTYLGEYIQQLLRLIEQQIPLTPSLITHKLEELLLVLIDARPDEIAALFSPVIPDSDQLKAIVENNLLTGLNLAELAFLSHRSLASFKRAFKKAYGTSPGKYIRERKMELAIHGLLQGKKALDVSIELGYENLSNFNTAFKRQYSQTPGAIKLQK